MIVVDHSNKVLEVLNGGGHWEVLNCFNLGGKAVVADGGDLVPEKFHSEDAENTLS